MSDAGNILEAIPWRCFHCDFITMDREEAAAHFGDRDDAEEFKPICKWWAHMKDDERVETLQDTLKDLNRERDDSARLRDRVEGLEHNVETQESTIRGYKPFKNCRSIYDVFCVYDNMEGRAIAAEERLNVKISLTSPPQSSDTAT